MPRNPLAQFYQSEAVIKTLFVGYQIRAGNLDRQRPILLAVSQTDTLSIRRKGGWENVELPTDSPLAGRSLGTGESLKAFRQKWDEAFRAFWEHQQISKLFSIRQGCVLIKMAGSRLQVRNFDSSQPWMKVPTFKDIRHVMRDPAPPDVHHLEQVLPTMQASRLQFVPSSPVLGIVTSWHGSALLCGVSSG